LVDLLDMPLLRPRALAFVRGELWKKLAARQRFSTEDSILVAFGVAASIYFVYAVVRAIQFWLTQAGALVTEVSSTSEVWVRAAAVALALAIGVPLAVRVVVAAARSADSIGTRRRWRSWRSARRAQKQADARVLIDRLHFLSAVPSGERHALVHCLRTRVYAPGERVVAEGEHGSDFYLIRRGQAEVVQVGSDGWSRRLAVLRSGDYFGELALLYERPRTATVRALSRLELFVLSREAFDSTIAPRMRERGLTLERIEERSELARMPLFGRCSPAELDGLVARLRSV